MKSLFSSERLEGTPAKLSLYVLEILHIFLHDIQPVCL